MSDSYSNEPVPRGMPRTGEGLARRRNGLTPSRISLILLGMVILGAGAVNGARKSGPADFSLSWKRVDPKRPPVDCRAGLDTLKDVLDAQDTHLIAAQITNNPKKLTSIDKKYNDLFKDVADQCLHWVHDSTEVHEGYAATWRTIFKLVHRP